MSQRGIAGNADIYARMENCSVIRNVNGFITEKLRDKQNRAEGRIWRNLEAHHKKAFYLILEEFLQQYSQFSPIEDKETLLRLAITYLGSR